MFGRQAEERGGRFEIFRFPSHYLAVFRNRRYLDCHRALIRSLKLTPEELMAHVRAMTHCTRTEHRKEYLK